ncbi:4-hydroxy-tetrahydrodipicolinate synthase [Solicola gregarius]|uniref:4-hydroxy-tetrahydrodipicolinate synthase n=1 Tax=Solicola gregarius TaxID=2908642 RepID=A0AA46THC3_9ACTN|nr:4-hydroxy-tetrahydrodipicolinate synthase [Solicola gregarius]UYM04523.1 4-hydroxy-tetrahydrodipicolinate synthase [Solicola gregarius]
MTSAYASSQRPFGRILTAMVTPFRPDGELDLDTAKKLANHLVDNGNDGLVVSGTTGESPTTNPDEDGRLLAAVLEAVGDRASVLAGVGNNDTQASARLARQAKAAGAHGLLLVSPYYNKPPQAGLVRHFAAVTEAGDDVPVLLYDIPGRAGVRIAHDTYAEVAKDPRIVGVKDAVGDLASGAWVMSECGLALYSGDDALNLAWLAVGAAGMVSTVGHVGSRKYAEMADAVEKGDLATARRINVEMLPVVQTIMDPVTQGAIMCKAAMELTGVLTNRAVRSPLVDATDEQVATLNTVLSDVGLL